MATKSTDQCLAKAGEDEPIFVLRAQDALAANVVRYWANQAQGYGVDREKVDEARTLASRMEEWAKTHRVKLPD